MNSTKLDPKTCTERLCHSSENLLYAKWISSTKVSLFSVKSTTYYYYFCISRMIWVAIAVKSMVNWFQINTPGWRLTGLMVKVGKSFSLLKFHKFTRVLSRGYCS